MGFSVRLLADSISLDSYRLTTFEVTMPRIVLAEFNTHRVFSRNSASSRAIPVGKMIRRVQEDPYIPSSWGKNQKGMQANEDVSEAEAQRARSQWLRARDHAVFCAGEMLDIGIHKQTTNRLLEPFMWHTVIVSSTEWTNFENLRDHPAAHPDIQTPAHLIREARAASTPKVVLYGEWHLPLVESEDTADLDGIVEGTNLKSLSDLAAQVSAGRCARVSYLAHDGRRDISEDLEMFDKLVGPGHLSPLEHPARPMTETELRMFAQKEFVWNPASGGTSSDAKGGSSRPAIGGWNLTRRRYRHFCGNYEGWIQRRKLVAGEDDIHSYRRENP